MGFVRASCWSWLDSSRKFRRRPQSVKVFPLLSLSLISCLESWRRCTICGFLAAAPDSLSRHSSIPSFPIVRASSSYLHSFAETYTPTRDLVYFVHIASVAGAKQSCVFVFTSLRNNTWDRGRIGVGFQPRTRCGADSGAISLSATDLSASDTDIPLAPLDSSSTVQEHRASLLSQHVPDGAGY